MNSEQNGKHESDREASSLSPEFLTAMALGELDAVRSRQWRDQLALDPKTQQVLQETERLAAVIQDGTEQTASVKIEGLEQEVEEALNAQLGDVENSSPTSKPTLASSENASSPKWTSILTLATMILIMIGGGLLLIPQTRGWILPTQYSPASQSWAKNETEAPAVLHLGTEIDHPTSNKIANSPESRENKSKSSSSNGIPYEQHVEQEVLRRMDGIDKRPNNAVADTSKPAGGGDRGGDGSSRGKFALPSVTAPTISGGSQVVGLEQGQTSTDLDINLQQNSFGASVPQFGGSDGGGGFGGGGDPAKPEDLVARFNMLKELYEDQQKAEANISQKNSFAQCDIESFPNAYKAGLSKVFDQLALVDEQYEQPPENGFVTVEGENALSTFSIDVDTASYANARRFLQQGRLPPPAAVRLEEFINYFNYDYPQPEGQDPFSVQLDLAHCPWTPHHLLLRVGLKGKEINRQERPASNLVFLVDVSGSMSSDAKLPLLKRSLAMLVDQLTENDRISIVTYAGNAGVQLSPTSGDQKEKIQQVIRRLDAAGSTHGSAGIELAYELASQHFIDGGTNRVILATDGDLNVGITDDNALVDLISHHATSGTFLTVLGFGTGNLKDAKLEKLADHGNGHYRYIDSLREGHKVLIDDMSGNLITIAKDVKLQIEFNPAEIRSYRLLGYENRALATEDFSNDLVDAGDIGAGHTVTAFYELVPSSAPLSNTVSQQKLRYQQSPEAPVANVPAAQPSLTDAASTGEWLTLSLRYKQPDASASELLEIPFRDSLQPFEETSSDFRFAAAVTSFGMTLRNSKFRGNWNLATIESVAAQNLGEDAGGYRAEFVDLVRQAQTIGER